MPNSDIWNMMLYMSKNAYISYLFDFRTVPLKPGMVHLAPAADSLTETGPGQHGERPGPITV